MERLGIDSSTVKRILVTHLHYDHTGNLDVLPDAELLVPAIELDFWLSPMGRRASGPPSPVGSGGLRTCGHR